MIGSRQPLESSAIINLVDPTITEAVNFSAHLGVDKSQLQSIFGSDFVGLSALSQTDSENPVMIHPEARFLQHLAHIVEMAKDPKGVSTRVDGDGVVRRSTALDVEHIVRPQFLGMIRACKLGLAALELVDVDDHKTSHQIALVTMNIVEHCQLLLTKTDISASLIALADRLGALTSVSGHDIQEGDHAMMLKRPVLEAVSGAGAGAGGHHHRSIRITPVPLALLDSQVVQIERDLDGGAPCPYPSGLEASMRKRLKSRTGLAGERFNISAASHWAPGVPNFYQVQSTAISSEILTAPKAYGYSVAMPYARKEALSGIPTASKRDPEIALITRDNMQQLIGHLLEVDAAADPTIRSARFWGPETIVVESEKPKPVIHLISLLSSSRLSSEPMMPRDHDGRFDDYEDDALLAINAAHPELEITKSLHPVNAVRGMVSSKRLKASRAQSSQLVSKIANNLIYAAKSHGAKPSMTANQFLSVAQLGGSFSDMQSAYTRQQVAPSVPAKLTYDNRGSLSQAGMRYFNIATQALTEIVRLGDSLPGDQPNGMRLNYEMHMAALEVVTVRNSGGSVAMRCKSGKDRAGQTFILAEAIERFCQQVGRIPQYDSEVDQAILGRHFAEVFHAGIFQENASQNALGSAGLKDDSLTGAMRILSVLPGLCSDMCPKHYRDIIGHSTFESSRVGASLNKLKFKRKGKAAYQNASATMDSAPLLTASMPSGHHSSHAIHSDCDDEASLESKSDALSLRELRVQYLSRRRAEPDASKGAAK